MHLGDDVLAVDQDARTTRGAQCRVQDRPMLRGVDFLPAEHRLDALAESTLGGQLQQQSQRLLGDSVLRVIEE